MENISVALVAWAFLGCLVGMIAGLLPGLGALTCMAMSLPLVYSLDTGSGIAYLAAIYYGAQYASSTGAILWNMPGETSSMVTAIQGHKLHQQGQTYAVLKLAAIASFIGGLIGIALLGMGAHALSHVTVHLKSHDYVAFVLMSLMLCTSLIEQERWKNALLLLMGMLFATIQTDNMTGVERFTFGFLTLSDGLNITIVAMACFGLNNLYMRSHPRDALKEKVSKGAIDKGQTLPILRGSMVGSAVGLLPGGGASLGALAAYNWERFTRLKSPQKFVAAPESANNAGAHTSFIPLLSLGIPSNPMMAIILAALVVKGVAPGPSFIQEQGALFTTILVSMVVGNIALVLLNTLFLKQWIRIAQIQDAVLYPGIVVLCFLGAYSINNNPWDCLVLTSVLLVTAWFTQLKWNTTPLLIGFILGPILEENTRRTFMLQENTLTLWNHPSVLAVVALAVVVYGHPLLQRFYQGRKPCLPKC